jgi:hypothetical protein
MIKKSVISLISYDARYLPQSIKTYYNYVDEIILGLDEKRISWSGNKFTFDEEKLFKELEQIDGDSKISVIEDDFYRDTNKYIENDNFERNFLKSHCSHNWVMSFDADEELINAQQFFTTFCPIIENYHDKYDFAFTWFLPYKEFPNDYLVIANEDGTFIRSERQGFATHKTNQYIYARWTNLTKTHPNRLIFTPLAIKHWSLCRPKDELHQKINNIGHADITERGDPFYDMWQQVTLENYHEMKNFKTSGLGEASQWPSLIKIPKDVFESAMRKNAEMVYS